MAFGILSSYWPVETNGRSITTHHREKASGKAPLTHRHLLMLAECAASLKSYFMRKIFPLKAFFRLKKGANMSTITVHIRKTAIKGDHKAREVLTMYKKVLVPLDGSELAECALPQIRPRSSAS